MEIAKKEVTGINPEEKILFFSSIVENTDDAIISKDLDGIILSVNHGAEVLYGYKSQELIGKNISILLPKDQHNEVKEILAKISQGKRIGHFETKRVTRNKKIIDVSLTISPIKKSDGKIIGASSIARDITKEKLREKELTDQKNRLSAIIEGTRSGTWEWNIQTGETIFNEYWANIIGYTLKELEPISIKTWEKFGHPEDMKKSEELLQKHFKKDLPYYEFEARMKHKDGHWVWVLDRGKVSSWTEDGNPLMMFGTHQDITVIKKAEEDMKQKYQELEKLNHLMVGRELKMIELKQEINRLKSSGKTIETSIYQKGIDLEEKVIQDLKVQYEKSIEDAKIDKNLAQKIIEKLEILRQDSERHEQLLKELSNHD